MGISDAFLSVRERYNHPPFHAAAWLAEEKVAGVSDGVTRQRTGHYGVDHASVEVLSVDLLSMREGFPLSHTSGPSKISRAIMVFPYLAWEGSACRMTFLF